MEIAAAAVGAIMSCFCRQTCVSMERCKYMINPTKQIARLRKKMEELIALAADVKGRLLVAEGEQGKVPTNVVQNWLNGVEDVINEMNAIENKVIRAEKCLKGLLPDCCSRSALGQHISGLIKMVNELLKKGGQFSDDSLSMVVPKKGMKLPTTRVVGKSTAQKTMGMVWKCLMDDETRIIGVYGMGGVGKTTIMKGINNRLLEEEHFDKVIWITVSNDASVHKLQYDITKALNLVFPQEQDETGRSGLLLQAFERSKRFALILDDMWQTFLLHQIGIPEPTEANKCKLILTTRSLEVCRRMGCRQDNIIKLDTLLKEEAWELFMDKVDVELNPEVMEIAKEVAEECAGLPLAIITTGGTMRGNDDISEWRVALNDLRDPRNRIMDREDNVFKCLKFSYDRLADEKLRKCLLCCALYPEDWRIQTRELIGYWIIDGLIEGRNMLDELDQGQTILNKLKNHCLLESVEMAQGVKMHDLIRDMALQITSQQFVVKAGVLLEEIPNEAEWGVDLERASFMGNKIEKLSISPKCPALSTLFLNKNHHLYNISHHFFVHMQGLRVLDLRDNNKIQMLPNSISDLVNLRALRLAECWSLKIVPSLAKLLSLRMLELDGTAIEELPHGIEMLVNLKYLSLRWTPLREGIPIGLIRKLSLLQKLDLFRVNVDKIYVLGGEEAFVEELLSLKHLESLIVSFRCLSDFASYIGSTMFKGLKDFHIEMSDLSKPKPASYFRPRCVEISNSRGISQSSIFLPPNTELLRIHQFHDLTRLYKLGCLKDMKELRECWIHQCNNIECILSSEDEKEEGGSLLQYLDILHIYKCPKFYTLCKGIPSLPALPCLKVLLIDGCPNLKNVFSSLMLLQQFQNLEEIKVQNCYEMEKLIVEEETGEGSIKAGNKSTTNTVILPKLKELVLSKLPKLKSIYNGVMVCDFLQTVEIEECDELNRLPQFIGENGSPPPALKRIKGNSEWWRSLEWDAYPIDLLQSLV